MRRYAISAMFGLLLPALVIVLAAAGVEEMPGVESVWPLLAALGASVVMWGIQAFIYAVLARSRPRRLRLGDALRVEMAGLFVALVSPIRGAELPYKVYLFGRLGLSPAEGTNLVVTRVVLDAVVLTPAALAALALYASAVPGAHNPNILLAGLAAAVVLAAVAFLARPIVRRRAGKRTSHLGGSGRRARAAAKVSGFLREVQRSFAAYRRPGHRATLVYAIALTTVYWALRLSAGPLALMTVGWSGDWLSVVAAQLLLVSFVLPFAPTPGGGGARELGLAALLSGYVQEGQLLGGLILHAALAHWLPLVAGALFAGHELSREILRRGREKTADRRGYAEA